jgi:hypothetical protein
MTKILMGIAISSVGLATAQGNAAELVNSARLQAPGKWPWPVNGWTTSHLCRPALGVSPTLRGIARWQALVQIALKNCLWGSDSVREDSDHFGDVQWQRREGIPSTFASFFNTAALNRVRASAYAPRAEAIQPSKIDCMNVADR